VTDDLEVARTFLAALAEAAKTGDFDGVYPPLALWGALTRFAILRI
jgi:hypothetical protein